MPRSGLIFKTTGRPLYKRNMLHISVGIRTSTLMKTSGNKWMLLPTANGAAIIVTIAK